MANPFHHPETTEVVYRYQEFDRDKDADMVEFMDLLGRAANSPETCGIHQHDIRDVHEGLGLVKRFNDVVYWEAKNNGTQR